MVSKTALPGVEIDRYDWPDEDNVRFRGGRYVRLRQVLVQSHEHLSEMARYCSDAPRLYWDTETSGLNPHQGARIIGHAVGVPVSKDEFWAWYIPIRHRQSDPQLPVSDVSEAIQQVLAKRDGYVTGHHLKYDRGMARVDGVSIQRQHHDTATLANIYDENLPAYQLKWLADKYLYKGARTEEQDLVEWMKRDARQLGLNYKKSNDPMKPTYLGRFGYSRTPIKLCGLYACKDVFYTWGLEQVFLSDVLKHYARVYGREIGVAHYLHEMEWEGLPADVNEIQRAHEAIEGEIQHWLSMIRHYSREPDFEVNANEVSRLVYDKLGLDPPKYTPKGEPSVDKEARQILAKKHKEWAPLFEALDAHAKAEKIRSTYTAAFLRHVTPEQKIHPSYNQIDRKEGGVPVTGRLSSQNPNIQNVAKKPIHLHACRCEKCAKKKGCAVGEAVTLSVRRYFTVPDGWVRAYIDLSQIELRVLAWLSRDARLLYCYANDLDVHQITADEVTGGDRDIAKQVNFGNNYGMTEVGLAKRLPYYAEDPERALEDAKVYLDRFFQTYSGILPYRRKLADSMRRNNCMFVSPFGRPRRIPLIDSDDKAERTRAERMMMSSIVSGTAADLMKEIMLRSGKMLYDNGHHAVKIVKSIHDEIVYSMPIKGCSEVLPKLMHCFTDWPMFEDGGVPIRASCELTTTTWEDKREVEILDDGTFRWAA